MTWFSFGKPDFAKLEAKRDVPRLIRLLESKDASHRYPAVEALGRCGDERAIEPLIRDFRNAERNLPRDETLRALGAIAARTRSEPEAKKIAQLLFNELGEAVYYEGLARKARSGAIAGLKALSVVRPSLIIEACTAEKRPVADGARHMMRWMPPESVPALLAALDDPKTAPFAIEALGVLRFTSAADRIHALAQSGPARVAAAQALAEMGDARCIPLIVECLASPDPFLFLGTAAGIEARLVGLLTQFGEHAVPSLVRILSSQRSDASVAALNTLRWLNADVTAALVELLKEGSASTVARMAATTLAAGNWKPSTLDERIGLALTNDDVAALHACRAQDAAAVAAAVLRCRFPRMDRLEVFGDASAIDLLLRAWNDCIDTHSHAVGSEHIRDWSIARALDAVLQRNVSEASDGDLQKIAALKDRVVRWYPTRDGEPHLGYSPSSETISLAGARGIATKELARRQTQGGVR